MINHKIFVSPLGTEKYPSLNKEEHSKYYHFTSISASVIQRMVNKEALFFTGGDDCRELALGGLADNLINIHGFHSIAKAYRVYLYCATSMNDVCRDYIEHLILRLRDTIPVSNLEYGLLEKERVYGISFPVREYYVPVMSLLLFFVKYGHKLSCFVDDDEVIKSILSFYGNYNTGIFTAYAIYCMANGGYTFIGSRTSYQHEYNGIASYFMDKSLLNPFKFNTFAEKFNIVYDKLPDTHKLIINHIRNIKDNSTKEDDWEDDD